VVYEGVLWRGSNEINWQSRGKVTASFDVLPVMHDGRRAINVMSCSLLQRARDLLQLQIYTAVENYRITKYD
jgi:hypothetical protein